MAKKPEVVRVVMRKNKVQYPALDETMDAIQIFRKDVTPAKAGAILEREPEFAGKRVVVFKDVSARRKKAV